ncbi:hypothetical protein Emed_006654 [Eimeria media]
MNAAVLEEPPCVCEVYADCVRLRRQRGVTDEVYIHRIDSSGSSSNGEKPSLQLSPSPPAAAAGGDQRVCLERLSCWGAFGVFLEPQGGYLLLVETADRVAQLGAAQILNIKSFRAIDLRLPIQQQQQQQQHEQQQRWASHTRQLRRPLRLRLGDAVAAEVSVTTLRPVSDLETPRANTSNSSNSSSSNSSSSKSSSSSSGSGNEDSPYLPWLFEALAMGGFFCSLTVDLTVSLQRALQQAAVSPPVPAAAAAQSRGDEDDGDRFLWNRLLLLPLQEHAKTLGLRAIQGYEVSPLLYVGFGGLHSSSTSLLQLLLISRRDTIRLGARYHSRGLDLDGGASNFVETEQLLLRYYHDPLPSYIAPSTPGDSKSSSSSSSSSSGSDSSADNGGSSKGEDGGSSRSTWRLEIFGFVQVRGSIPLLWKQEPSLSWAPPPQINVSQELNNIAAKKHFSGLVARYGEVEAVNLIDKKGWQRRQSKQLKQQQQRQQEVLNCQALFCMQLLGEAMEEALRPLQGVRFLWFDFHAECRRMQWGRLSKLLLQLQSRLDQQGFLRVVLQPEETAAPQAATSSSVTCPVPGWRVLHVYRQQKGVLRTNCVDCLDRTNVVESVFARSVLHKQLQAVSCPPPAVAAAAAPAVTAAADAVEPFTPLMVSPTAEETFRALWTANADALSILYSGTPALKTDFTRTGKRSTWGAIMDTKNSCCRYFINNFSDGFKEDCLALCTSPKLRLPQQPPQGPAGLGFVVAEYLLLLLLVTLAVPALLQAVMLLHATGAATTRLMLWPASCLLSSGLLFPALLQSLPLPRVMQPVGGKAEEGFFLGFLFEALAFAGGCLLVLLCLVLGGVAYVHSRRKACISLPLLKEQQQQQEQEQQQQPDQGQQPHLTKRKKVPP